MVRRVGPGWHMTLPARTDWEVKVTIRSRRVGRLKGNRLEFPGMIESRVQQGHFGTPNALTLCDEQQSGRVPPTHPSHLVAFPHAYQRKPVAHVIGFFFSRKHGRRLGLREETTSFADLALRQGLLEFHHTSVRHLRVAQVEHDEMGKLVECLHTHVCHLGAVDVE